MQGSEKINERRALFVFTSSIEWRCHPRSRLSLIAIVPHEELALAWTTPVQPDVLGGHLQAYIDSLPVVATLRFSRNLGQSSDVYVTKLQWSL